MAKWYAYGPMSIFAYQVFLAFNGKDPLSVYNLVPLYVIADIARVVRIAII